MKTKDMLPAITALTALLAQAQAAESAHYYVKPFTGISYMNDVTGKTATAPVEVELEKGLALGSRALPVWHTNCPPIGLSTQSYAIAALNPARWKMKKPDHSLAA